MVANAASDLGMKVVGYDPFITIQAAHSLYSNIPIEDDLDENSEISTKLFRRKK